MVINSSFNIYKCDRSVHTVKMLLYCMLTVYCFFFDQMVIGLTGNRARVIDNLFIPLPESNAIYIP